MCQDLFVWLSLTVLDAVEVLGIGSDSIARAKMGKVALHIA